MNPFPGTTMRALSAFILLGLLASGTAVAQEEPPLPIYLESWTRATLRKPFGGSNDVLWQIHALGTVRSWLAVGPEFDALYAPIGQRRLGLRANLGLTKNITFGVFAGYEFSSAARAASTGLGPDWLAARGTLNFAF